MTNRSDGRSEHEYVVVGSGAGGGTVAARLTEMGHSVLLLEAGGDPLAQAGNRLPDDYRVPMFHPFAAENPGLAWDFFVHHYASDDLQRRNPKYHDSSGGVLYPRGAALGGSTALNALVTLYPHDEDWDAIARMTGDPSWSARRMRSYFERLEDCGHRPVWKLLSRLGFNPTRHGFAGWLRTEMAIPAATLEDKSLSATLIDSAAVQELGKLGKRDPNDWRVTNTEGLCYLPLATRSHERNGTRERLLAVAARFPDRLTIELDALATRVLFDETNRATGVEYLKGARLYRAHKDPSADPGERREARVSREVILAGGAYNTPQLLMLSGIGPPADLAKHGIPVRVALPGVGGNLQDRYEVGVVYRMNFDDWWVLEGAQFAPGDPLHAQWAQQRQGFYTTNGTVLALRKRSAPDHPSPDLICYAFLGPNRGYYPAYSEQLAKHRNYLTWVVRKAHTANSAGAVRLRSADPRDPPSVAFHYFDEGNDAGGEDLRALVEGIRLVRRITAPLRQKGHIAEEELPGESVQSGEQLADFVRFNAWGHDASCTCPIGDRAGGAVVNGNFEVHGTRGLRIVDASVFPKTPGFFIASGVYMIGEKAADVISRSAKES